MSWWGDENGEDDKICHTVSHLFQFIPDGERLYANDCVYLFAFSQSGEGKHHLSRKHHVMVLYSQFHLCYNINYKCEMAKSESKYNYTKAMHDVTQ